MRHRRRRSVVHTRGDDSGIGASQRLSTIITGSTVELLSINAGHRLTHRLNEMGLTPGVQMKVVQNSGGPVLLSVRGTRIALGRGTAEKILVEVTSN